jgi:RNA polymerase sigma factor (sigma-70 family)
VCHEVFKKLVAKQETIMLESIVGWLFVVAKNTALKAQNKRKRFMYITDFEPSRPLYNNDGTRVFPKATGSMAEVESPMETMARSEYSCAAESALHTALIKLPARLKEIVRLRYYEELSYASIAEKLNLSQGNVGFLLNKAMTKLKAAFASKAKQLEKN